MAQPNHISLIIEIASFAAVVVAQSIVVGIFIGKLINNDKTHEENIKDINDCLDGLDKKHDGRYMLRVECDGRNDTWEARVAGLLTERNLQNKQNAKDHKLIYDELAETNTKLDKIYDILLSGNSGT